MLNKEEKIVSVRNIAQIKTLLKQKIHLVPVTQYPDSSLPLCPKQCTYVNLEKIREFSSIMKTNSLLIIGLKTNLQRIMELGSNFLIPQLLLDLIHMCFYYETLQSISLLEILGKQEKYTLLRLAFCALNAKILVVKNNKQNWMPLAEYCNSDIFSFQAVPLSLSIDLNINIIHSINVKHPFFLPLPSFAVVGIVELDKSAGKILDIRMYLYKQGRQYFISQELKHFKLQSHPVKFPTTKNKISRKKLSLPFLTQKEQNCLLETLVSLLQPTLL